MSKAWQANIPGFIFYGILFVYIFVLPAVERAAGFLGNEERVAWVIDILAERTPFFDLFSPWHFTGNFVFTVYAGVICVVLAILLIYQGCISKKTKCDNIAVRLGRFMYAPIIVVLPVLFAISLIVAWYFYPAI